MKVCCVIFMLLSDTLCVCSVFLYMNSCDASSHACWPASFLFPECQLLTVYGTYIFSLLNP
jgi:hypothetical protein